MGLTRRELLSGLGAAAVGGLGVISAQASLTQARRATPLQFYGGFASGILPDLSPPSESTGSVLWSGPKGSQQVALTFDDGPMPDWTPRVLATLARHDVPATFFLKGINVLHHGEIHRGSVGTHELGTHTWDHPDLARLDYRECTEQIARTSAIITRTYGKPPTLFRPPYGHLAGSSLLAATEQRLTTVLWSMQMLESRFEARPAGIVDAVRGAVRPGSIILAHDTGPSDRLVSIDQLDDIISGLKADGFTFTTVSNLCRLK